MFLSLGPPEKLTERLTENESPGKLTKEEADWLNEPFENDSER